VRRFIYDSILKHLPRKQITLLVGARQVGKTTLLQQVEDHFPSNFLKYHYDTAGDQRKFVVTGSSHFYIDQKFTDSMAGRKRIFELPTLGLGEVLHFRGRDDLGAIFCAG
jgi:predicted AAA+ superfamily ATPase